MIKLTESLPEIESTSAEYIKIKCLFDAYKDDKDVLFWEQNQKEAYISLCDGNMIIDNRSGDIDELREFINVMAPISIFSDFETMTALGLQNIEKIYVNSKMAESSSSLESDELNSSDIYEILNIPDFFLPDYPSFAVDLCRRLRLGNANYFGLKGKCAAVSFHSGNFAILNGIVSRQKGLGKICLNGILSKNNGREFIACSKEHVKGFYEKNEFKTQYIAGFWCKNECKQFFQYRRASS